MRIHVSRAGDAAPDVGRASQSLGPVVEYGASKGVIVVLENDDLVSEDAFFLAKVIDQVNSPWLRALPDARSQGCVRERKLASLCAATGICAPQRMSHSCGAATGFGGADELDERRTRAKVCLNLPLAARFDVYFWLLENSKRKFWLTCNMRRFVYSSRLPPSSLLAARSFLTNSLPGLLPRAA